MFSNTRLILGKPKRYVLLFIIVPSNYTFRVDAAWIIYCNGSTSEEPNHSNILKALEYWNCLTLTRWNCTNWRPTWTVRIKSFQFLQKN